MEIEHLKELRDNPSAYLNEIYQGTNKGLSASEIDQLESIYNNGMPFPKVLRESLFLAGKFCYVLDFSLHESQQELQDAVREYMTQHTRVIDRPFFAIDVYNHGINFCSCIWTKEMTQRCLKGTIIIGMIGLIGSPQYIPSFQLI